MASLVGCQELEAFGAGCAGILGNVLNAVYIVILALFAFLFFGEIMTPVEIGGAALIGGAVLAITAIKAWRRKKMGKEGRKGKEGKRGVGEEKRGEKRDGKRGGDEENVDDDDVEQMSADQTEGNEVEEEGLNSIQDERAPLLPPQ